MSYENPADKIREQIARYTNRTPKYASRYGTQGHEPTQAELETYRYVLEEQENRDREKRRLHPVETILDLLNRGQYVTANIGQELKDLFQKGDKVELGKAALEGITGKTKGDWEDVLLDWYQPETRVGKIAKGIGGFAANVFLDPTTYIGFGPAKAAKAAAKTYADDMTRILMKYAGQNVEKIPGSILQKLDKTVVSKLAKESPEKLAKYLSEFGGDDFARYMNKTYKDLYKRGLRVPGKKLSSEMEILARQTRGDFSNLADDVVSRVGGQFADSAGKATKYLPEEKALQRGIRDARYVDPEEIGQTVTGELMTEKERFLSFLDKIIEEAPERYGSSGLRAWSYLGKEFNVKQRYPFHIRAIDKAQEVFKKSKIGGVYSDAVWSFFENPRSVVGKLKKAFNVRNPYQQSLEAIAADIREEVPVAVKGYADEINKIIGSFSDDEKKLIRDRMIARQMGISESTALSVNVKPQSAQTAKQVVIDNTKIEDAVERINKLTQKWYDDLQKYADQGLIKDVGEIENYLPIQEGGTSFYKNVGTTRGHMGPGFTRERSMDWAEHIKRQVEKTKWLYGVNDEIAEKIVNEGFSDLNMDLERMLVSRAIGQAKVEARVKMLQNFRGFGLYIDDMSLEGTDLIKALSREGSAIQQLGLRTVNDPALKGYLFDNDVARILERAVSITQHDESIKGIAGWIRSFNNMWKGWATLSPGFHARNEISNNITGFLNHGVKWFDPNNALEATVATAVGLYGEEAAVKYLSKTLGRSRVMNVLAKQYGDRTVRELADYATKKGVVTRATMGFDLPSTVEEFLKPKFNTKKLNVFSQEFAGLDVSRRVGSLVESQSKMQNFLLDYKEIVKFNKSDAALDWAKTNTKKWFLDYADLSEFEQKYMKSIMPFYSWIRKNLANQITGLVELTPMYSVLSKELNAVKGSGGPQNEELPDYMRELGYIPSFELKDERHAMFWPNIPLYDLNKIPFKFEFNESGLPIPIPQGPGEVIKEIAASANPLLKTIVEIIPEEGWHTFYKTPLGKQREAPGLTQVFKEDGKVVPFIDGVLRAAGVQDGLRAGTDEEGNLLIDGKMAQILENNIPQLKRIPEFLDAPELLIHALKGFESEITGKEDSYDALEAFFKVLSFNLGIKFKPLDVEQMRRFEAEDILKAAEEARAEDRRDLPQAQIRRTNYINNRLQKQRRMGLL